MFPHLPGGPILMFIVDECQSRLDPKFITYINDKKYLQKVCFGIPHATVMAVGKCIESLKLITIRKRK